MSNRLFWRTTPQEGANVKFLVAGRDKRQEAERQKRFGCADAVGDASVKGGPFFKYNKNRGSKLCKRDKFVHMTMLPLTSIAC